MSEHSARYWANQIERVIGQAMDDGYETMPWCTCREGGDEGIRVYRWEADGEMTDRAEVSYQ
jgi:hypothetical protein